MEKNEMLEIIWFMLLAYIILLCVAYGKDEQFLKVAGGLMGVVLGLQLTADPATSIQYFGVVLILANVYIAFAAMVKG